MKRQAVIDTLLAHQPELRAEGISHLFLFGSVARDDADEKSDVDLFFEYDTAKFSLIDLVKVQSRFRRILRRKVDALTRDSIHPRMRRRVEAEAIQVF